MFDPTLMRMVLQKARNIAFSSRGCAINESMQANAISFLYIDDQLVPSLRRRIQAFVSKEALRGLLQVGDLIMILSRMVWLRFA